MPADLQSTSPSALVSFGAWVASKPSWGSGSTRTEVHPSYRVDQQLGPGRGESWRQFGRVSPPSIDDLSSEQHRPGVESGLDLHRGDPRHRSPAAIAAWIGAAPRYLGSSEACTLTKPRRGHRQKLSRSRSRRTPRPHRGQARAPRSTRGNGRRLGLLRLHHLETRPWPRPPPADPAPVAPPDRSRRLADHQLRPVPLLAQRRSDGTANSGVPKKTMRSTLRVRPLPGAIDLLEIVRRRRARPAASMPCGGPSSPSCSIMSIKRAAREKPTLSRRWRKLADALRSAITRRAASSNISSSGSPPPTALRVLDRVLERRSSRAAAGPAS